MIQVMSLPYLLQSLVSTKKATCVQPQSKGTVHHYPVHCNDGGSNQYNYNNTTMGGMEDRSSTANCTARVNYQCCPAVAGSEGGGNVIAGAVQVKREVMDDQTQQGRKETKSKIMLKLTLYCNIASEEFLIIVA